MLARDTQQPKPSPLTLGAVPRPGTHTAAFGASCLLGTIMHVMRHAPAYEDFYTVTGCNLHQGLG